MSAPQSRVILVTGANRGIGYGIVRRLAKQYQSSYVQQQTALPLKIYVGSRSAEKGKAAIAELEKEIGEELQKDVSLTLCQLDMNDKESRSKAVQLLKDQEGGLDTLIDNAGIAMEGFDANVVRDTFKTNFYDLIDFNNEILPILRPHGRIVIVASMAGALNGYSSELVRRFRAVSTVDDAKTLAAEYQKEVDNNTFKQNGWKEAAYSTSKACLIAYTRGLANELRQKGSDISVNCLCPGYVNTMMTKGKGVKTIDQGAATPVMLALDDLKGRSGGYFQDQREKEW